MVRKINQINVCCLIHKASSINNILQFDALSVTSVFSCTMEILKVICMKPPLLTSNKLMFVVTTIVEMLVCHTIFIVTVFLISGKHVPFSFANITE